MVLTRENSTFCSKPLMCCAVFIYLSPFTRLGTASGKKFHLIDAHKILLESLMHS